MKPEEQAIGPSSTARKPYNQQLARTLKHNEGCRRARGLPNAPRSNQLGMRAEELSVRPGERRSSTVTVEAPEWARPTRQLALPPTLAPRPEGRHLQKIKLDMSHLAKVKLLRLGGS